jgi:hypothetical protein
MKGFVQIHTSKGISLAEILQTHGKFLNGHQSKTLSHKKAGGEFLIQKNSTTCIIERA